MTSHQPERGGRVTIEVPAWLAAPRDPGVRAVLVLAALGVAGFVVMVLGWRGAARTAYVPLQMPWVVSGGLTGLALVGMAGGAWSIHLGRRADAEHRAAIEAAVRDAVELAEDLRSGRRSLRRR